MPTREISLLRASSIAQAPKGSRFDLQAITSEKIVSTNLYTPRQFNQRSNTVECPTIEHVTWPWSSVCPWPDDYFRRGRDFRGHLCPIAVRKKLRDVTRQNAHEQPENRPNTARKPLKCSRPSQKKLLVTWRWLAICPCPRAPGLGDLTLAQMPNWCLHYGY